METNKKSKKVYHKPRIVRIYHGMSDAEMIEEVKTIRGFFIEDMQDFVDFDADFSDPFSFIWLQEIEDAEGVTKDPVIKAQQTQITSIVNKKMKEARDCFQDAKYFIEKAFPNKRSVWNEFGYNVYNTARRTQPKMIQFMMQLYKTAKKYKTKLVAVGFSPAKINAILTLQKELANANSDQEQFKGGRPVLTDDRIEILNKPWATASLVCKAGKRIYKNSPAKFQRYILSTDKGGKKKEDTTEK